MFDPKQYRDKASAYSESGKAATEAGETREFARLEQSFTALADNEQWLADNHAKTVRMQGADFAKCPSPEEEEQVLRCLGAAVIMQWNAIPRKLQRELFDAASSVGELMETAELRSRIARFLHKHQDETAASGRTEQSASEEGAGNAHV